VADPVSICNMALGWLGEKPITSLDVDALAEEDRSTAAELCSQNYASAVKAVLEERAWTFATGWLKLAADATPPVAPDFSKRFLLPATVLKVLDADNGSGACDLRHRREGSYVVADVDELLVRCILLEEDPNVWSGSFALAVSYKLASLLAIAISENRALHADMVQLYRAQLADAGRVDAPQGRDDRRRTPGRAARARG
jgi:hypothetical protein